MILLKVNKHIVILRFAFRQFAPLSEKAYPFLGNLFHLKFRSHAHLKSFILEDAKTICSFANIHRGFGQLFPLGISCILEINAEAFTDP